MSKVGLAVLDFQIFVSFRGAKRRECGRVGCDGSLTRQCEELEIRGQGIKSQRLQVPTSTPFLRSECLGAGVWVL
jgi:hypothetical protein